MKNITVLGIDLAKNVYQLHANDEKGRTLLKKQIARKDLIPFVHQLPRCIVAMEACGGSHFLSRKFSSFGHEVRLISPQFVKPFVKGNKNDAADAAAICEAAVRPSMHFVPTKEVWHQDVQIIHRVRERHSTQRTALCNQIRGILAECGLATRQGISPLKAFVRDLLQEESEAISSLCRITLCDLMEELRELEDKIEVNDERLKKIAEGNESCKRLMKIKGLGKITATALVAAVPNPGLFKNGRQFAAWLGLVPKHTGTGGKNRMGRISKRGDKYLRCLLVHGARSGIRKAEKSEDKLSKWVAGLKERRGYNKAAVALANKNARMIWAMLARNEDFNPSLAS